MNTGTAVESGTVRVQFGPSPLEIRSISYSPEHRTVCTGAVQELLVRPAGQVSEPVFLREVESFGVADGVARFSVTDHEGEYRAQAEIGPSADGLRFACRAEGREPIWMIEWQIKGLGLSRVIIPALGGQSISDQMPDDSRLTYKYPFWWNAQFAIGMTEQDEGIWFRTMDPKPRFKMLRVGRGDSRFDITLGFEADAPLRPDEIRAEFYLDDFMGGWQTAVDIHRTWLGREFDLVSYTDHPAFPEWARRINLVLELWGMRRDRGLAAHTFRDMIDRLEAFSRRHPPEETLVYLPGFSHGGIDSRIPDYAPSEMLGGAEEFARLIDRAHELGYRVMIHTNVLGMTYNHPLFERFKAHQVVDVFGRPQGWAMDLDGDWLTEPYFAYINPGAREWTDLMESVLGSLIHQFGVDGVFLDQTLLAFNVESGPDFVDGMRTHIEHLQAAFPDVLFAGEGINEHVLPALPMVQIHGVDSIAGVHGIEDVAPWRQVHPVSTCLFGPHTRFVGHLLTKHPSHPVFARQEAAYRDLGVIPVLVCYSRDQQLAGPSIDAVLDRARTMAASSETAGYQKEDAR